MPNATSVWDFTAGDILTAAKLDDVNCGVHVFSGTATRDAAYGGSGERTLVEGEFAYLADTNTTQYYNGTSWISVGSLSYVTGAAFTTASTVVVDSCFTSNFRNYLIRVEGLSSAASPEIRFYYRAGGSNDTNSSYAAGIVYGIANNSVAGQYTASTYNSSAYGGSDRFGISFTILAPQVAVATTHTSVFFGKSGAAAQYGSGGGIFNNTTQFDGIQIYPSTGTITGTYRIYGMVDA